MLREVVSNEWFTILIVMSLSFIAMAKFMFEHRFYDFLVLIGNSKYLKIYGRDQKFVDGFDTLLFLNLIISVSIFTYITYSTLIDPANFNLIGFSKLLIGIGALLLIKILLERLLGSLFEIDDAMDQYLFQKTSFKNLSGLFLLPINILLIYTIAPSKAVIFGTLGLMVLINIIGFATTFKSHQNMIMNNLFYFILYLCALEIGPYLILYHILINY
ncbi:DUF4271 domain-containing protein [Mangrovimonas xylaniphaga]|uniref:DUF4271 domain-containing protein n=1 Tax=Mangrovimonas xylaniphaga TaxID=1645915 RepID=UPI0006B47EBA|nr:DUF4271 domain-containing protein [Mangrovimonas xylaniphaga]